MYKTSNTITNYPASNIYASIYPSTTPSVINSLIAKKTRIIPKKWKSRLPNNFRYFDSLILDNIDYIAIEK